MGELEHGESLLAGENRILEMVAKGESLSSILDGICRLVEEISSGSLCSILLLDDNRLWHGAAPSLPASYKDAVDGWAIGPTSGPCGRATYFRRQVIVPDIAGDPLGDGYRDLALAHGLKACWSAPIFSSEGKVLGSFAVLSRERRGPTPHLEKVISQITHLTAVAIEREHNEQDLRRSEAYLAEAQQLSRTGSFGWNVRSGELFWSAETFCIVGYDATTKPTLDLVFERIHPDDRALVRQVIDRAAREKSSLDFEHRLLMPDGVVKHVHVVARATQAGTDATEFVGAVMDVSARKVAKALVAGEKELLEMIARGSSLASVLDTLCRFGEEMCGNVLVSILLVSPDRKSLRHGAAPSLPTSYTEAIDGGLIGPCSGSCGTAAYKGERVIVSDIATDPLWEQYRHLAIPHGLCACWSTPILSTTREVMGTFALYSREPGSPSSDQLNLIEQITHLAAVAIERRHAEEALRRSESRFEGILAIADDAIISVDSKQRIVLFNQGAEKVFGYTRDEIIGKPLDILLPERFADPHRRHIEAFAKSSDVSRTMGQRREVFGRRKDGSDFPAEASISKLDLGGELVFTVILRDIAERKKSAEALHASEKLARGQVEALKKTLDALATESDLDRLLEHILCTITEQFEAHSSSVWRRDESSGRIIFDSAFEEGRLIAKTDAEFANVDLWLPMEDTRPWTEVFRTGKVSVVEDIRTGDPFPLRNRLLPLGVITLLLVPMFVSGRLEGAIGIRFTRKRTFRAEEIELAQALANQAMLAIQLASLYAQNRQTAVTAERNRMARDIHDTLAQGFTGVIMQLEAAKGAATQHNIAEITNRIERASELARSSLAEARRSVRALRLPSLQSGRLSLAIENLLKRMTDGSGLQAEFQADGLEGLLSADCEETLLRITQEALTNTIKHAQARNFRATLAIGGDNTRLQLADDGRGFDPRAEHEGFGLTGMRERVERMNGQFVVRSKPEQGTEIVVVLNHPHACE